MAATIPCFARCAVQDPELGKAVNDSGFPLQLGLKHVIQTGGARFQVAVSEHLWRDPLGDETKFLDLALRTGNDQLLVIECKRARETDWIFLREPSGQAPSNERRVARAWITAVKVNESHHVNVSVNDWYDVWIEPRSPITQYCVVRKNNQRTPELSSLRGRPKSRSRSD